MSTENQSLDRALIEVIDTHFEIIKQALERMISAGAEYGGFPKAQAALNALVKAQMDRKNE